MKSIERKEKPACANCWTLACSLAGDCFISSASLSLNFLNMLARAGYRSHAGCSRDEQTTGSEFAGSSSDRTLRPPSDAMFTWTGVGGGRRSAGSGNPCYGETIRGKHSGTGVEISRLPLFLLPPPLVGRILVNRERNAASIKFAEKSRAS